MSILKLYNSRAQVFLLQKVFIYCRPVSTDLYMHVDVPGDAMHPCSGQSSVDETYAFFLDSNFVPFGCAYADASEDSILVLELSGEN